MNGDWRGRRVTVTGGAGFIGAHLAERLVAAGARVRVVDNFERGRRDRLAAFAADLELIEGDLRDAAVAQRAAAGCEALFHLAARVAGLRVYLEAPGTTLLHNLLIDQQVFRAALAAGVGAICYASSAHVYPGRLQRTPDAPPLREPDAWPAEPALTYGWGKLTGEQTLLALARENASLRVALPRIMGAYGGQQDYHPDTGSAIPVFCARVARWPEGGPFRLRGDGRETRSYVYIDDVIDALLRSMRALDTMPVAGPFNLAAEGRATIRDIAERIVRISGKPVPIETEAGAPAEIAGQAADVAGAAKLLGGWRATTSLDAGLRRTYAVIRARIAGGEGAAA